MVTFLTSPLRFLPSSLSLPRFLVPATTDSSRAKMQFYSPTGAAVRPGLDYSYSAAAAAANQRMNWPPTMHPNPWNPYDFAAYSAAYPAGSGTEVRSPSAYHVSSPSGLSPHPTAPQASSTDQNGATRHNIADILGGQSQNLPSEIAKTGGAGYQKSPTSTTANMFSPTTATPEHVRSPTTPTHPHIYHHHHHHPGAGDIPANFYIPAALPRGLSGTCICMPSVISILERAHCFLSMCISASSLWSELLGDSYESMKDGSKCVL